MKNVVLTVRINSDLRDSFNHACALNDLPEMTSEMHQAQIAKIYVEIEKMRAETAKANKELRWYETTIIIAATLAVVAIAKLFL